MHTNIYDVYASELYLNSTIPLFFTYVMSMRVHGRSVSLVLQGPGASHAATAKRPATSMFGGVAKRGKLAAPVAAFLQDDED